MWVGRRRDAWDRTSLLAAIWSDKPAKHYFPFDSEGRPKMALPDAKKQDPDSIPYDPELMRKIVEGVRS